MALDEELERLLDGGRVLVLGLGLSGVSAATWCATHGASVVAADEGSRETLSEAALSDLEPIVELVVGAPFPDPSEFDLVVPSPGVPRERYADRARRILGDVELAARALRVPVIAVTGTNGKSTTVRLIEEMLRAAGYRARAAGNIGSPALSLVGQPLDVAVLEISSFQLEAVEQLRPRVAVVLNVTPDHLDRHGSFEAYAHAKARLLARQEPSDVAVLNFDDPVVRDMAGTTRARIFPVSRRSALEHGVFLDGGRVRIRDAQGDRDVPVDVFALPGLRGVHNLENVLAALGAVAALGADPGAAAAVLADFEGLPHRAQEVVRGRGVSFVDDSKATNPGAAQRSLESFSEPVLWIAGGRGKGTDLRDLAATAIHRARAAFLIGEATSEIEAALGGGLPTIRCDSIEIAVERAAAASRPGDVVLLAPACASHDQFASFEERGERFAAAARRWAENPGGAVA